MVFVSRSMYNLFVVYQALTSWKLLAHDTESATTFSFGLSSLRDDERTVQLSTPRLFDEFIEELRIKGPEAYAGVEPAPPPVVQAGGPSHVEKYHATIDFSDRQLSQHEK